MKIENLMCHNEDPALLNKLLKKEKKVAYSLKHKGQPILKTLIFKDIMLFYSYRDKNSCKTEISICLTGGLQEHLDLT